MGVCSNHHSLIAFSTNGCPLCTAYRRIEAQERELAIYRRLEADVFEATTDKGKEEIVLMGIEPWPEPTMVNARQTQQAINFTLNCLADEIVLRPAKDTDEAATPKAEKGIAVRELQPDA